jgi:hypothetical protein
MNDFIFDIWFGRRSASVFGFQFRYYDNVSIFDIWFPMFENQIPNIEMPTTKPNTAIYLLQVLTALYYRLIFQ